MTLIFSPFYQQDIKLNPNLDGTFSPGIAQLTEFYFEVVKGNIPGHTAKVIRGRNPAQSSSSGFVDVAEFGDLSYLTSAEQMNIVSTDPNDTLLGTGLRTMFVDGVDDDGKAINETVSMNGTTNVLTEKSYLRINDLVGLAVGSGEFNLGTITATAAIAGTVQDEMAPEEGNGHSSHYTVALGQAFYLMTAEMNSARPAPGMDPIVEFKFYSRFGGSGKAWLQSFAKKVDVSVTDELDITLPFPAKQPERSDIRFRSNTTQNDTETQVRYCGILVDNEIS